MALKQKITKEQFEKLSADIKTEYVEDGEGFRLDVEGLEDTGALKRSKDREKQLRQDAEKEAKELREQLDALGTDDARKKGDIATLEKSWATKTEAQKAEFEGKLNKSNTYLTKVLVENVAQSIANKISSAPAILIPHIKARLQADFDGDEPATRVLDKDGKKSALSIDDLAKEFSDNKDFSAIIVASKASGGAGKSSTNNSGGAAQQQSNDKPADLSKLSPSQMAAHITASKAQQSEE